MISDGDNIIANFWSKLAIMLERNMLISGFKNYARRHQA